MHVIALIGFVQTLFFSFLISTKRQKGIKDYLLIIYVIIIGVELIYRYMIKVVPESQIKWLTACEIVSWALSGPLILMYILFATNRVKRFRAIQLLHFIPVIIGLYGIRNYFNVNIEDGSFVKFFYYSTGLTKIALFSWRFITHGYLFYSLYILILHNRYVRNFFSDIPKNDLSWLFILISGYILILLFFYILWFIKGALHVEISFSYRDILPTILTVYVFYLAYYGFKQANIFIDGTGRVNGLLQKGISNVENKYLRSGLDEDERNKLIARLKEVMENEKPYLESDLNITMLAKMVNTSFHKLSQVINESFNLNFHDFISGYRIKESMELLMHFENEKYTIISTAYDCGFSSKSSFYNAFRKNTGVTPGEYLRRIKSGKLQPVNI